MKHLSLLILTAVLAVSSLSRAAGQNLAVCSWQSVSSDTNRLVIHQDTGGQLVALYTTESFGGSLPTFAYNIEQTANLLPQGGALNFIGNGISISIGTAIHNAKGYYGGLVSIPKMLVRNQKAACKLRAK